MATRFRILGVRFSLTFSSTSGRASLSRIGLLANTMPRSSRNARIWLIREVLRAILTEIKTPPPTMKKLTLILALFAVATPMRAGILQRGKVQLICHRTSNRDMPENTLEALALAARMGCNIVEVDIRMTLDGQLVLNHDGMLERLTEGMGDVESTSFVELSLLDTGATMGERFANIRIPRFTDALRVAREQ